MKLISNMFFRGLVVIFTIATLNACDTCEVKGVIILENPRLWCNCEVDFPNGDEYVSAPGETMTFEMWRGFYTLEADCGNSAFGNNLCGFEDGIRTQTFDIDCSDELYWSLDW